MAPYGFTMNGLYFSSSRRRPWMRSASARAAKFPLPGAGAALAGPLAGTGAATRGGGVLRVGGVAWAGAGVAAPAAGAAAGGAAAGRVTTGAEAALPDADAPDVAGGVAAARLPLAAADWPLDRSSPSSAF